MSQTCADARALKVYGNADATVVLTVLHGARLQSRLVLCPLFWRRSASGKLFADQSGVLIVGYSYG